MAMRATRSCAYGEISAGKAASTTTAAAGTSQPPGSRRAMSGSAPTSAVAPPASTGASEATLHQAFRPPDENDRHQQVDADAAPFGEEDLAEGVDDADQQSCLLYT